MNSRQKEKNAAFERQVAFTKKLRDNFPILWRKPKGLGYCVSPSTGPGWENIVWQCSKDIENAIESVKELYPLEVLPFITEVKEKFGMLRFGVGSVPDPIWKDISRAICDAEQKSSTVCEFCGNAGQQRGRWPGLPSEPFRWIKTLCENCWYEEAERRAQDGLYSSSKAIRNWYNSRTGGKK